MFDYKLTCDLQAFANASSEYRALANVMAIANTSLTISLKRLRKTWQTPAGKNFIAEFDDNWKNNAQAYEDTLKQISEILIVAHAEFSKVSAEIDKLNVT